MMKPQIMYAIYGQDRDYKIPNAIFQSRWKAKEAEKCLWNMATSSIERVVVSEPETKKYEISHRNYTFEAQKEAIKLKLVDREKIEMYLDAWYFRTLQCVDLDHGGKIIPPPSKSKWKASVRKDLLMIFNNLQKNK